MEPRILLHLGDCLEILPTLADNSVDAVITDPPYGTTANSWDIDINLNEFWKYMDIVKDKGNILMFGTGIFAFVLALSNRKMFRYEMLWKKSKCGSPLSAKYMPLKKHELILVFGQPASYYFPQMTNGKPYSRNYTPYKINNMGYGIKGVETNNSGTRHPTTLLDFPQNWRRQDQVHPTQKPIELMEWLINSYCPTDGIVLDPFMGSGATGVACVQTGRNFIGIEIEPKYFEIAEKRIAEAQLQMRMPI